MRIGKLQYLSVLALLLSCGEKLIEPPENLIPKDKMVLVLRDMAVINAAKVNNLSKLRENGISPTALIFQKYGIDSAQFVVSDRYYASLPAEYEQLYTEVETLVEAQGTLLGEQKKEQDSLAALKRTKENPDIAKDSLP